MSEWSGVPSGDGWHWLRRKKDGELRMAHWGGGWWHLSDSIGRTRCISSIRIARLYSHFMAVSEPSQETSHAD